MNLDDTFIIVIEKNFYTPIAIYDPRYYLKTVKEDQGLYVMLIQSLEHAREEAMAYRGESKEQEEAENRAKSDIEHELEDKLELDFFIFYRTKNLMFFLGFPKRYVKVGSKIGQVSYADYIEKKRGSKYRSPLKWIADNMENKFRDVVRRWDGKDNKLSQDMERSIYDLVAHAHH